MEYGLRIATPESVLTSPREWCDAQWGGDAQRYDYPDAPLTALYFGSEFCQELLPGIGATEAFCAHCDRRSLEAVLLTPIVTHRGLGRIDRLLGSLTSRGWFPAVVFNDWRVLDFLRKSSPCLPFPMWRLINRRLPDPQLSMSGLQPHGQHT